MARKRTMHSSQVKAKAALAAVRGDRTVGELLQLFERALPQPGREVDEVLLGAPLQCEGRRPCRKRLRRRLLVVLGERLAHASALPPPVPGSTPPFIWPVSRLSRRLSDGS